MLPGQISQSKWESIVSVLDRDTVVFAVLYGSQAIGEATDASDIDIAIEFNSDIDAFTELFRIEEEYSEAGFDDSELDLTVLNASHEQSFVSTVKEQSIVICGDTDAYQAFLKS